MSATLADIDLTGSWTNVVAVHASAASVAVRIQAQRGGVQVVHGGAEPTGDRSGDVLAALDSTEANAAAIWVRSIGGKGRISVTLV